MESETINKIKISLGSADTRNYRCNKIQCTIYIARILGCAITYNETLRTCTDLKGKKRKRRIQMVFHVYNNKDDKKHPVFI